MKGFHFAVAGLFMAACLSLHAQTINVRANIPFDFQLGPTAMPAGDYYIHHSAGVIVLRQQDGSHAGVLSFTVSQERHGDATGGELRFNRYGNAYFFEALWEPGSREGQAVRMSAHEKELARRGSHSPDVVAVRTN